MKGVYQHERNYKIKQSKFRCSSTTVYFRNCCLAQKMQAEQKFAIFNKKRRIFLLLYSLVEYYRKFLILSEQFYEKPQNSEIFL